MAIDPMTMMAIGQGISAIGGLFGKSRQRKAQKREAERQWQLQQQQIANQAAQNAYKIEFDNQMLDLYNKRTMEEFDIKLDLYDEQLQINRDAANSSYAAEQFKLNENMQQAALNRRKMYSELLRVQGSQAARGDTNVSKSRERADLINSIGEFGRDQAEFDKTIYNAKWAHDQRMSGIAGQHADADYSAWTKIAISPRLKLPGQGAGPDIINQVGPAQVKTGIGFGDIATVAGQGLSSYAMFAKMSDYELKENIKHVGKSPSGIHVYEFNYLGENTRYRGAMAQEVMFKVPEAVSEMDNGYLGINYDLLDVKMEEVPV